MAEIMDDSNDRLSELSDDVIHKIFSKLEIRDVVRTTVLSKRWVNLWTTVTCLNFEIPTVESSRNFINRVLDRWNGAEIKVFKIRVSYSPWASYGYGDRTYGYVNSLISFAIERKVEDLHILSFYSSFMPTDSYFSLPQSLCECSSIRKLTLFGCISWKNANWDSLKSLVIHGGNMTEEMLNRVISGSPQLETLRLCFKVRPENVNIESSSLRILELASSYRDRLNDTRLTIRAPKLKELAFIGSAFRKCSIKDTLSLTNVILGFTDKRPGLLRETLRQIIPPVKYVEAVKLSFQCSKALGVMVGRGSFITTFSNSKLLDFVCCPNNMKDAFGILEAFPELERLIIRWTSSYCNPDVLSENSEDVAELSIPDFES